MEYQHSSLSISHSILLCFKRIVSFYYFQNYWNFDLECNCGKHRTSLWAQKVTGTVEKQAPEENQTGKFFLDLRVVYIHLSHTDPGLSLRAGGRGFPPATMNVVPGYFHWKIEENRTKRNPWLFNCFPTFLLYLLGNLKS